MQKGTGNGKHQATAQADCPPNNKRQMLNRIFLVFHLLLLFFYCIESLVCWHQATFSGGVMHHFHFSWSQLIVLWKFFVRLKVQIGNAKWNFHPENFTYIWNVRIFVGGFIRETTVLLSSEWTRLFSKLDVYVQLWITSYWLIQNKTISCDREATHTMSTLPMKSENSLCRRRDVPVGCTFSWRGTPFLLVVHFVVACPPTTIPL